RPGARERPGRGGGGGEAARHAGDRGGAGGRALRFGHTPSPPPRPRCPCRASAAPGWWRSPGPRRRWCPSPARGGVIAAEQRPAARRTRRKPVASKATGAAVATAARKATTVRLEPALITGLSLLQRVLKKPMNRMVNEAVRRYVERQSAEVETNLQKVLERVQA